MLLHTHQILRNHIRDPPQGIVIQLERGSRHDTHTCSFKCRRRRLFNLGLLGLLTLFLSFSLPLMLELDSLCYQLFNLQHLVLQVWQPLQNLAEHHPHNMPRQKRMVLNHIRRTTVVLAPTVPLQHRPSGFTRHQISQRRRHGSLNHLVVGVNEKTPLRHGPNGLADPPLVILQGLTHQIRNPTNSVAHNVQGHAGGLLPISEPARMLVSHRPFKAYLSSNHWKHTKHIQHPLNAQIHML